MVEPISLLGMIWGLVAAVRAAQELWLSWKKKQAKKALESGNSAFKTLVELVEKYNRIALVLGGTITLRLDSSIQDRLLSLQPALKQLNENVITFSKRDSSDEKARRKEIKQRMASLLDGTNNILNDIWGSVVTPDEKELLAEENTILEPSDRPRSFCQGALFLMNAPYEEKLHRISQESLVDADQHCKAWGFTCKFCALQVGRYRAVRMSSNGKPLSSQILLAASHLTSQRGLLDRRAFYRCLACFQHRKEVDFASAAALEAHMKQHPGFTIVVSEPSDAAVENKVLELIGPIPSFDMSHNILSYDTEKRLETNEKTLKPRWSESTLGSRGLEEISHRGCNLESSPGRAPSSSEHQYSNTDCGVSRDSNRQHEDKTQAFIHDKPSNTAPDVALGHQELENNPSPLEMSANDDPPKSELKRGSRSPGSQKSNDSIYSDAFVDQQNSTTTLGISIQSQSKPDSRNGLHDANEGQIQSRDIERQSAATPASTADSNRSSINAQQASLSPAPITKKWIAVSKDGQHFFYCPETSESVWDLPAGDSVLSGTK